MHCRTSFCAARSVPPVSEAGAVGLDNGVDSLGLSRRLDEGGGARPRVGMAVCDWISVRSMRPQPLICATDVQASSRWYQQLLGVRSDHGGPNYERLVDGDQLVMQLHNFDVEHDHGRIGQPDDRPYGNGVLLWFEVDDFDAVVNRGTQMGVHVVMAPHRNPPEGEPGGPPTASSGCTTPTATPSCWQAPTARIRCRKPPGRVPAIV
jgi:catechol 2,3-dioxygenase-like lactoylglutathione lyase family enzyme